MRALVTGASGFVGSELVRACRARGFETVAAVRAESSLERIHDVEGLEIVHAELRDPSAMRALAVDVRPDVAFHLAWRIGADVHDSPENIECVSGSIALLRGLERAGCGHTLFVGTYLEYAPSDADLCESSALAPQNFYATTKNATRELATAYAALFSMRFSWARLFNVYGPREPSWPFIPTVIRTLLDGARCDLRDGSQVRAYLHVEDVAEALVRIGTSSASGAFNVGSSDALTIRDLANRIADAIGHRDLLRFGALASGPRDVGRVVADVSRLRDELGFVPSRALDDGLATAIAYWRQRRQASPSG